MVAMKAGAAEQAPLYKNTYKTGQAGRRWLATAMHGEMHAEAGVPRRRAGDG
jgi:hypothetical protein